MRTCCRHERAIDRQLTRRARRRARKPAQDEPWAELRRFTAARIALPRSGASLATAPLLEFRLAHARARDAVHAPFDDARLCAELAPLGLPVLTVASAAQDRQHYLDASRPRPPARRRCRGAARRPCRQRLRRRVHRRRRLVRARGRGACGAAAGAGAAAPGGLAHRAAGGGAPRPGGARRRRRERARTPRSR